MNIETLPIVDNPAKSRYEMDIEGDVAVATYQLAGDIMTVTHVGVPRKYSRQGIGTRLTKYVLDDAIARGLRVRAACSFVRDFMLHNPEYLKDRY